MSNALIGYSGFVGSTLMKQGRFDELYRSTNINTIDARSFDLVVCAGAPAQKWIANADPEGDRQKIDGLIERLSTLTCETFVLISTVDVFKDPRGVDENSIVDEKGLHPYGLNRLRLERFVAQNFPRHLIVRLPGLVGPGLRKNVIFDLLNDNNLNAIESRSVFQFYPMVNLWYDIETALRASLDLVHLTAEPVEVAEVAMAGFGQEFTNTLERPPVQYDMRSCHGQCFGVDSPYQYNKRETLQAVRAYAQSEPVTISHEGGTR